MPEIIKNPPAAATRSLDNADKAAVLLVAMGKPIATRLLERLAPEELKRLAKSLHDVDQVTPASVESIIVEFAQSLLGPAGLFRPGQQVQEFIRDTLLTSDARQTVAPDTPETFETAWEMADRLSAKELANILMVEHPQAVALAMLQLAPSVAAEVVALFDSQMRRDVFWRILTAKEAPPDIVAAVEEGLRSAIINRKPSSDGSQAYARVANILNKLEVDQTDEILEDVTVRVPDQAPKIKALLFSFQDIVRLEPASRTALFDKVPTDKVVLALRGAPPELREAVLSSLTARARRMLTSELEVAGPAPESEIKRAMRSISDLALELASKGEIVLPDASPTHEDAA